jgi:hypothetical protein
MQSRPASAVSHVCLQPSAGPVAARMVVKLLSCDALCSLLERVSS